MSSIYGVTDETSLPVGSEPASPGRTPGDVEIPRYLTALYWWAYVHPRAVKVFERQWLANLILWGNYARLRDAALAEMVESHAGRTLQVACVYGDLTCRLSGRVAAAGGDLDVVDVLQIQLDNLRDKLPAGAPARLLRMDSTDLSLPAARYDRVLVFFLLHEQPEGARERTLREAFRVAKPGGRIVIVDYARPRWWHPLRYLWRPLLAGLEPFALDLWRRDIAHWLPPGASAATSRKESFFGGLYQKVVVIR
ncbi:MAG TPA: rhodoquinone biosynthesis methyltransferase RquA [Xanthobacteraceae bacterium]|jgi:ubiquinone/menaquinone biosynthesis C-methylase UbiE